MAWSDLLENLIGMKNAYKQGASQSKDRTLQYNKMASDSMTQGFDQLGAGLRGAGEEFGKTIRQVGQQDFASDEARKEREWQSAESEKTREGQVELQEKIAELDALADKTNYTYETEYKHPWAPPDSDPLVLKGDGTEGQHDINVGLLRAYNDKWDAMMSNYYASRASKEGKNNQWEQAIEATRNSVFFDLTNAGLIDETMGKLYGEMSEDEYARAFNEALEGSLSDNLLDKMLQSYGIPSTPENIRDLRELVWKTMDVNELDVEPVVPETGGERKSFLEVAGNPLELIRELGEKLRGSDVGQAIEGAQEEGIQRLSEQTLEPEGEEITGEGVTSDIARMLERIVPQAGQDIQGIWEKNMLQDMARIEGDVTPEELQRLQEIYNLIAGEGKWDEAGMSRSDWKALMEEVQALARKY